uniref:PX domain-containing protein n=1 Tax=Gadus morhua TaxID=8049 RepID=A0A8C5AFG3_GADMO
RVLSGERVHNAALKCVSPAAPSGPPAQQGPLQVNVPCYLLRGQGKDEHYEYEVKISVGDETWTVFRRYSRFREMHRILSVVFVLCFDLQLAALDIPPKKLFGNRDERMINERRGHLEVIKPVLNSKVSTTQCLRKPYSPSFSSF